MSVTPLPFPQIELLLCVVSAEPAVVDSPTAALGVVTVSLGDTPWRLRYGRSHLNGAEDERRRGGSPHLVPGEGPASHTHSHVRAFGVRHGSLCLCTFCYRHDMPVDEECTARVSLPSLSLFSPSYLPERPHLLHPVPALQGARLWLGGSARTHCTRLGGAKRTPPCFPGLSECLLLHKDNDSLLLSM